MAINTIDIYCDEAGIPPLKDDEDIFVVSAVALPPNDSIDFPVRRHTPEYTAFLLSKTSAVFASCVVRPFAGYATLLEKKLETVRFVSDVSAKTAKPNAFFTAGSQFRAKAFVWSSAMETVVAQVIVPCTHRKGVRIESVRLFFNAMTLSPEMRRFFMEFIKQRLPDVVRNACATWASDPSLPDDWRTIARNETDRLAIQTVEVEFDDDPSFRGHPGLVKVADSLSHHTRKELLTKDPKPGMFAALKKEGLKSDVLIDLASILTMKIDRTRYQEWEKQTGVQLPE